MQRLERLTLGGAFLAACVPSPRPLAREAAAQARATRNTIVVVSFDAFGDRFLDRDTLPNFARIMREGVRAPAHPEFPSKTFPNHYSMATGLTPGQHGIVLNQFFDPARDAWFHRTSASDGSWFGGEPIWVSAERAGFRTAAYFWTGSEAAIEGVRPTYWHPFDATVSDSAKLHEIMHWLRLPDARRPRLIMMYSGVVDVAGHRYGPEAKETYAAVRVADHFVGALRDSLAAVGPGGIDLVIVSDHGLISVPRDHDIDIHAVLPTHGALVDDEHATLAIWQDPAGPLLDFDSLATALRQSVPHAQLYRRGTFPARWQTEQNPRFGDLFLLAEPGYEFVDSTRAIYTLGEHGYDPATPEMTGIFLAVGPDFRPGVRLDARENRALHDLLARLLHLNVPHTTSTTEFGLRH